MAKIAAPHALTLPDGREFNKGDMIDVDDVGVAQSLAELSFGQRVDVIDFFNSTAPKAAEETDEPLPLLYILGTGSKWDNNEIRYSLRSAEKYFKHSKVFIVGERPAWLQNIEHIEAIDPYDNKLKNSIHKLHAAVQEERLPQRFVLMNDDFYFAKETKTLPVYHKGSLSGTLGRHPTSSGYYYEAMWVTKMLLEKAGIENANDYSLHFPMVFDKARVHWLCSSMRYKREGFLFRTFYANYFKLKGTERSDVKLKGQNTAAVLNKLAFDMFSTDDDIIASPVFQKWIAKKYPKPSRYEADTRKS